MKIEPALWRGGDSARPTRARGAASDPERSAGAQRNEKRDGGETGCTRKRLKTAGRESRRAVGRQPTPTPASPS